MPITSEQSQAIAALLDQHLDLDATPVLNTAERVDLRERLHASRGGGEWDALTLRERRLANAELRRLRRISRG